MVGGDAEEFELGAGGEGVGQVGEAIAGEHQFLQLGAGAEGVWESGDLVVGEDEPAEVWGEGSGIDGADLIGLEADHCEVRAGAEAGGKVGERVIGAEEDAEFVEAMEVVGEGVEAVAGEVEDFEGVGEGEDFGGEVGEAGLEVETGGAGEGAGAELIEGVHAGVGNRGEGRADFTQKMSE